MYNELVKTTIHARFKAPYEGHLELAINTDLESEAIIEAVESFDSVGSSIQPFDGGEILIMHVDHMEDVSQHTKKLAEWLYTADRRSKINMSAMSPALIVSWSESERGWGCRNDGYSLHKTQDDVKKYIASHWVNEDRLQQEGGFTGIPDQYSRPDNEQGDLVVVKGELLVMLDEAIANGIYGLKLRRSEYLNFCKEGMLICEDNL